MALSPYNGGMSPEPVKMSLRLDPELHQRLKEAAERSHRSIHAQVLVYIERGLEADSA